MKALLITTVLLLSSCTDGLPTSIYKAKEMPIRWCVDICMEDKFEMFNNEELLGSSSSMNGISEVNIFDKVHTYCKSYYKDGCFENRRNSTHWPASDTSNVY